VDVDNITIRRLYTLESPLVERWRVQIFYHHHVMTSTAYWRSVCLRRFVTEKLARSVLHATRANTLPPATYLRRSDVQ